MCPKTSKLQNLDLGRLCPPFAFTVGHDWVLNSGFGAISKSSFLGYALSAASLTQKTFHRSVGLDKKIIDMCWTPIIGNPRKKKWRLFDSRKVKVENYQSPMNLNIPTEILAFPVFEILGKNELADPNLVFDNTFHIFPIAPL